MKSKVIMIIILAIALANNAYSQNIKKLFAVPIGNNRGEIGPDIKEYKTASEHAKLGKNYSEDQPWGVYGIGLDEKGNILLLDSYNGKILKYSLDGVLLYEITDLETRHNFGDTYGKIYIYEKYIVISSLSSITIYDKSSNGLVNYIKPRRFPDKYRSPNMYRILNDAVFYSDNRFTWYIQDITDQNITPMEINNRIENNFKLTNKDGLMYLPDGDLLFWDLNTYVQKIIRINKTRDYSYTDYLGEWNGYKIWNNKTTLFIVKNGNIESVKLIDNDNINLQNIHMILTKKGQVIYTIPNIDTGSTGIYSYSLEV